MKTCPFCRGRVLEQRVEHVHRWQGSLYIFRNVPAEVCTQCGETFFGPKALKAFDRVVGGKRKPEEVAAVPVYTL